MADRLDWIRLPVEKWVDWEPLRGSAGARALVAQRYPKAACFEVVANADEATQQSGHWWQRLGLAKGARVQAGPVPPEESAQLVWSNMQLHQSAEPVQLIADWLKPLTINGFLMFSCLGPDTLRELRALYAELGWAPPAQEFVDMHDWGDLLITSGFADPVMFMEHITLTFPTAERALHELRGLGRNNNPQRFAGLRTPRWRKTLEAAMEAHLRPAAGEALSLTFEVVYGHAVRPKPRLVRGGAAPKIEFNLD